MARYTGPVCKLCRREGKKLYLKGDRCYTPKCAMERRPYAPGQHGQRRTKVSEYGLQLREKQKARRIYGVLEKPFRHYYEEASRQKGITGANLLRLCERRLDNVVFRLGFASSRSEARQLVLHGHFSLNGGKASIPSILVKANDVVAVKEKSMASAKFKDLTETAKQKNAPAWLQADAEKMSGVVLSLPTRDQIDTDVSEQLIVELYSK